MLLNHLDLLVHDVQRSASFFEHVLGFRHASSRTSPALVILEGDGGFVLVLQRRPPDAPAPSGFHFGFLVDHEAEVHRARERVAAHDHVPGPLESDARGLRFYCHHDDLLIEVRHRPPT